ncbi:MAG: tryptophan 7-halogenase [Planctomycetaceae bacterium]|nr:tryptophan 7-halogenase [Planctomycetaceae bacterium]
MTTLDADVLIVGSGFAGSLTALLAKQIGLRPVLVDRGSHPRFVIGESTTPVANLVLESLARRFDLPWLAPLATYGSWKATYPDLPCGLKRGFSYFHQEDRQPYQPRADHANELLVAASHGPDDADTHWLRADFDAFLVQRVIAAGIPYFDRTKLGRLTERTNGWTVEATRDDEAMTITAKFLVDASGDGGFLTQQLGLPDTRATLRTWSRGLYGHFVDLAKWEPQYRAACGLSGDHPYPCDAAAVHHVFDGGWMWQLRFDNGVTSAGFALANPVPENLTPADEWRQIMDRFPSVAEQFASATLISNHGELIRTGRLQRRIGRAAGPNWALLPSAAGFIDALHSTGIAHTLVGIERLLGLWQRHWDRAELVTDLVEYDRLFQAEIAFIDTIVAGSFRSFRGFPKMVAITMFYFASAIWSEHRRRSGTDIPRAFLCADDPRLRASLEQAYAMLDDPTVSATALTEFVTDAVRPYNIGGLCDAAKRNMYPYLG